MWQPEIDNEYTRTAKTRPGDRQTGKTGVNRPRDMFDEAAKGKETVWTSMNKCLDLKKNRIPISRRMTKNKDGGGKSKSKALSRGKSRKKKRACDGIRNESNGLATVACFDWVHLGSGAREVNKKLSAEDRNTALANPQERTKNR